MNTIKVKVIPHNWSGEPICEMSRSFFRDLVFRAMYYPSCSISVDNYTLSGTTLLVKQAKGVEQKRYAGVFKKRASALWAKAKNSKRIVFKSQLEHVEYVIIHEEKQSNEAE